MMPIWALVLVSSYGFVLYLALAVFFGTRSETIFERACGNSRHDHEPAEFFIGVFWPVAMPIFTAWAIGKTHTAVIRTYKEE